MFGALLFCKDIGYVRDIVGVDPPSHLLFINIVNLCMILFMKFSEKLRIAV